MRFFSTRRLLVIKSLGVVLLWLLQTYEATAYYNTTKSYDGLNICSQNNGLAHASHTSANIKYNRYLSRYHYGNVREEEYFFRVLNNQVTSAGSISSLKLLKITAEDDYFVVGGGDNTSTVLANDSLGGVVVDNTIVTLNVDGSWPPGFALESDGEIAVDNGMASGTYFLDYEICEKGGNSGNCATATVTLLVLPDVEDLKICLGSTASLKDAILGPLPAGYDLEWYTTKDMQPGTQVSNPAAVAGGTYYAFFIQSGGNTKGSSPHKKIDVSDYGYGESGVGRVNGNDFSWSYAGNAPSNPVTKTIIQPGTNHGFTFDIYELDNSFNMKINGVQLASEEIEFQSSGTEGRNIKFADGDQYEVNTDKIYHIHGTPDAPLIRIKINSAGVVSLYGSKTSGGELYPLIPIQGNSNSFYLNPISWNINAENRITVTQGVYGRTTMKGQGYGLNTVLHPCLSDVAVDKRINNSIPFVGDTVEFTIAIENKGLDDADKVLVTDYLPSGYNYLSSTSLSGKAYDDANGLWNIGYLANGEKDTLRINAKVLSSGTYDNIVWGTSATYDPDLSNDTSVVSVRLAVADLQIKKEVNSPNVDIGDTVTFAVSIYNDGPDATDSVIVNDILPSGYNYVDNTLTEGSYDEGSGVWKLNRLENDDRDTLWVRAKVNVTNDYENTASITSKAVDPDHNNDTFSVSVEIDTADLQINKTVDQSRVNVGSTVTFTISAYNAGPDEADSVEVNDILPSGYDFIQATSTRGSYNEVNGIWNLNSLKATDRDTLWLRAEVNPKEDYENIAFITSRTIDSDPNNDTFSVSVVIDTADIAVSKAVDHSKPYVGDVVEFTMIIRNLGPDDADHVVVVDTLPEGYSYSSSTPEGVYDSSTREWRTSVGSLAKGEDSAVMIKAIVQAKGDSMNVVSARSDTHDPNLSNNVDSAFTTPIPSSDIAINKVIDSVRPNEESTVKFTITVTNNGLSKATSVKVTDLLDDGYTFIRSTPARGTYNPSTGIWSIGDLAYGESLDLMIEATVNSSSTHYDNTATATNDNHDPDPDNNSSTVAVKPLFITDVMVTKQLTNTENEIYTSEMANYEITVTNNGPKPATDVIVKDEIPDALDVPEHVVTPIGFTNYSGTDRTFTWRIDSLPVGASVKLTFSAKVVAFSGLLKNTATVSADQPDTSMENNSSITRDILIISNIFYMPNAFSPNGDGQNDVFKPFVKGQLYDYEFRIYNRWGKLLFISHDPTKGWDGTFHGHQSPIGAYVWWLQYNADPDGNPVSKKGSLTLIR